MNTAVGLAGEAGIRIPKRVGMLMTFVGFPIGDNFPVRAPEGYCMKLDQERQLWVYQDLERLIRSQGDPMMRRKIEPHSVLS